jgi:hypothetical protein
MNLETRAPARHERPKFAAHPYLTRTVPIIAGCRVHR